MQNNIEYLDKNVFTAYNMHVMLTNTHKHTHRTNAFNHAAGTNAICGVMGLRCPFTCVYLACVVEMVGHRLLSSIAESLC